MADDARPVRPVTFAVRVYEVRRRQRDTKSSYEVRWRVAGRDRGKTFATRALANSFRATLMAATNRGEAFDVKSGLPLTQMPVAPSVTWWAWMLTFVDIKWPTLAPSSRRSLAEGLVTATLAMLTTTSGAPKTANITVVLRNWACNSLRRKEGYPPEEYVATIRWLERHTIELTDLYDAKRAREVLDALAVKLDGTPASATTIARKRAVLHQALEYAVERDLLDKNPLLKIRWRAPKVAEALDPRSVINPAQAVALLEAVRAQPAGRRLVAFFGCIYYAGMRPGEVSALRVEDLELPEAEGEWGQILVSRNNPQVATAWTDDGKRSARQLKHRASGEVRRAPCPPQLVKLLKEHLAEFNRDGSPRVFRGAYGSDVQAVTYAKAWREARKAALSPAELSPSLARRPYDLRHAAVSTWLAAGVDSTQVASWAGHSVQVLHRVYAHILEGNEPAAQGLIAKRLALSTERQARTPCRYDYQGGSFERLNRTEQFLRKGAGPLANIWRHPPL